MYWRAKYATWTPVSGGSAGDGYTSRLESNGCDRTASNAPESSVYSSVVGYFADNGVAHEPVPGSVVSTTYNASFVVDLDQLVLSHHANLDVNYGSSASPSANQAPVAALSIGQLLGDGSGWVKATDYVIVRILGPANQTVSSQSGSLGVSSWSWDVYGEPGVGAAHSLVGYQHRMANSLELSGANVYASGASVVVLPGRVVVRDVEVRVMGTVSGMTDLWVMGSGAVTLQSSARSVVPDTVVGSSDPSVGEVGPWVQGAVSSERVGVFRLSGDLIMTDTSRLTLNSVLELSASRVWLVDSSTLYVHTATYAEGAAVAAAVAEGVTATELSNRLCTVRASQWLRVGVDATIDGTGGGFGSQAASPGCQATTNSGTTLGYGGSLGGVSDRSNAYACGSFEWPASVKGSGGAGSSSTNGGAGGAGGAGLVLLVNSSASSYLELNGTVRMNGVAGVSTTYAGSAGSGGTLSVSARTLRGNGLITANGGDAVNGNTRDGGRGAGGRIAVHVEDMREWTGTAYACGGGAGSGSRAVVGPGTVYWRAKYAWFAIGNMSISGDGYTSRLESRGCGMIGTSPAVAVIWPTSLQAVDTVGIFDGADMQFVAPDVNSIVPLRIGSLSSDVTSGVIGIGARISAVLLDNTTSHNQETTSYIRTVQPGERRVVTETRVYVAGGAVVGATVQVQPEANLSLPELLYVCDGGVVSSGGLVDGVVKVHACATGVFTPQVTGCMNSSALNFNPYATLPGACTPAEGVPGCTYKLASNYEPGATSNDGSCVLVGGLSEGCSYASAVNYNAAADLDDGSCYFIPPDTEATISDLTVQITTLQANLSVTQVSLGTCESELTAERAGHSSCESTADGLNVTVTDQQADLANRDAFIASLQAQLAARDATITSLQAQVASQDSQLAARDATIITLQDTVAARDDTITSLQGVISGLQGSLAAAQQGTADLQTECAANTTVYVNRTIELQRNVTQTLSRVYYLEQDLASCQDDVAQLQQDSSSSGNCPGLGLGRTDDAGQPPDSNPNVGDDDSGNGNGNGNGNAGAIASHTVTTGGTVTKVEWWFLLLAAVGGACCVCCIGAACWRRKKTLEDEGDVPLRKSVRVGSDRMMGGSAGSMSSPRPVLEVSRGEKMIDDAEAGSPELGARSPALDAMPRGSQASVQQANWHESEVVL